MDQQREAILEKLSDWGWSVVLLNTLPRVSPAGMVPSSTYEITNLEHDRQPVVDDRVIPGDKVTAQDKTAAEQIAIMRKHLGWKV